MFTKLSITSKVAESTVRALQIQIDILNSQSTICENQIKLLRRIDKMGGSTDNKAECLRLEHTCNECDSIIEKLRVAGRAITEGSV